MSNKKAKEKLIELYGAECFIEKLKLRQEDEPRRYTSKGQYKRMKSLTYHHIKEKRNGGTVTVENGALLSAENHAWFNKQSPKAQEEMNKLFQKYKDSVKCDVVFVEELELPFSIKAMFFETRDDCKYNRAREKRKWQKEIEEER